jgi:hypothetical protein
MRAVLLNCNVPEDLVAVVVGMFYGVHAKVKSTSYIDLSTRILHTRTLFAPYLFEIALDYVMKKALPDKT